MLTQIFSHTPVWVWVLLAALIALGLSQVRDREVSLKRVTILPLVMIAFSATSVMQNAGKHPSVVLVWLIACAVTAMLVLRSQLDSKTHYQASSGMLSVAGSWVPMFLILTIFIGKFALAVFSKVQPEVAQSLNFTTASALIFGALSGVFLGRAARLWKLVASAKSPILVQAA